MYSDKNLTTGEKPLVELMQNISVNKHPDKEEKTEGKGHCTRKQKLRLNVSPSD